MLGKLLICAVVFLSAVLWGQAPADTPAFLAADVHVSPKGIDVAQTTGGSLRNSQYEMRGMTMLYMIGRAFGMDNDKIVGGPRWLELDKFDVIAKAPPGTKNDAIPPMLKKLLAERFELETHVEQRPLPGFTLTVGKGKPKLQPGSGETKGNIQPGSAPMRQVFTGKSYTMAAFANVLRNLANGVISSPVVDQTGLEGTFDFELEFTPPGQMAAAGSDGISIFDAIEKLGLKLEQKSTPQTVLVIDRVNQTPSANAPGVAESMDPPPPPATIDVSTVKPTAAANQRGFSIGLRSDQQGLLFDARNMKISNLLPMAWGLPVERVVGLPPNADSQAYDVVIRVNGTVNGVLSTTMANPIFQQFLQERFNLKAHLEDRPVDAYRLVAVKPKLAKADPENRASCKEGPAPGAKDPRQDIPSRSRLITCRNITMAEFAERLQNLSGGYVRTPIVDATKLEGMWDFTLNFSPMPLAASPGALPQAPVVTAAGGAPTPLDPSDALTLFDAITSQLGLKLELEKRPMPVLVIEHIDDRPTEN